MKIYMIDLFIKRILSLVLFLVLLSTFSLKVSAVSGSPPIQANSEYTTPSGQAPSDGSSTETVSVHLRDTNQNNVVGDVIVLSSSDDSTMKFPQNNQTTDSNGNATFTINTTTPGTHKITLYDSTNNVTFTNWFTVTFYDVTKGCTNTPTSPKLTSVVSNSGSTATLTWINVDNPVSNYLISYGTESKNYIYGNPNVGGQGTKSYTVGGLSKGKKYYFAVAANNNCGTGGYSNEASVIIGQVVSTSAPTTKPVSTPTQTIITPSPVPTVFITEATEEVSEPTETPQAANSNVNMTFLYIGVGIFTSGLILIISVFVIQKTKYGNRPQRFLR
jgi:hypothetical protein